MDTHTPSPFAPVLHAMGEGLAATEREWQDVPHRQAWHNLYEHLYSGAGSATYPRRAKHLDSHGWTPEDLERVCSHPREVSRLSDVDDVSEQEAEALAVLMQEATIYYSTGLSSAAYARTGCMARLVDHGWSRAQVGWLVGLTKQRVQQLVKAWQSGRPRWAAGPR